MMVVMMVLIWVTPMANTVMIAMTIALQILFGMKIEAGRDYCAGRPLDLHRHNLPLWDVHPRGQGAHSQLGEPQRQVCLNQVWSMIIEVFFGQPFTYRLAGKVMI